MRAKLLCSAVCLVPMFFRAAGQEPKPPATLAELQQRFTECVSQPKYDSAFWGVKVISLDTGKTLFEHNPRKLLSPASNSKLYTVALALDRLGADYRIKTSLYADARPRADGTLEGDLILFGRGDPTINQRLHRGDLFRALEPLVRALTNAGVRRVTGDLVGDQSFFRGPEFGSGWAWDDMQYYYGAEVSALTINDNTLRVTLKPGQMPGSPCELVVSPATSYLIFSNLTRTAGAETKRDITFYRPPDENLVYVLGAMPAGTNSHSDEVTMHNPAALFVGFLREALARQGISVAGKVRTVNWLDRRNKPLDCAGMVELGYVESLPLSDIAREIQKPSQNLYADLVLAHVGETFRSTQDRPEMTSEELGIRELNRFLLQAGVAKGEVIFEEGSGLSRDNLTTPNATVSLLRHMNGHKCSGAYIAALPIAGVDGSLRNRMKQTAATGNVRAKTGSLRWASSLSGYVTTAAGERLAFCLMLNRYDPLPPASARTDLDALAVLLEGFTGRTEN